MKMTKPVTQQRDFQNQVTSNTKETEQRNYTDFG